MFMIEIAGVNILYTGDFSRQEDRHLMSAEIPSISPDVLIMESTYGTHVIFSNCSLTMYAINPLLILGRIPAPCAGGL